LVTDHPPIVAFGPNSANPHYEPGSGGDRLLQKGDVVLLDLWGGRSLTTVFADQTWMAFAGTTPPPEVTHVWEVVRAAREAAIETLTGAVERGDPVTGAALDRAARAVITNAGYGDVFVHRTGHSIDVELHGSGPHLDSFETNDTRVLLDGIGFSVEPGVYLPGRFGVRSEVNVVLAGGKVEVTPGERQEELITSD
jgi:Xaa-Pro dipeptidase